jgi:steroid 5-alpha reductase family enzyme
VTAYRIGRRWAELSRLRAFAIVVVAYALAGVVALLVAGALQSHHPVTRAFVADLAATAVVFGLSMLLANSSLYDPYWSVAPPAIAAGWVAAGSVPFEHGATARQVVVLVLVFLWAVRLTGNWSIGWHGLMQEDWRYVHLRETRGPLPWWLVSLTGVQLVPTLIVFLGLLPLWPALGAPRHRFNWLDVVAAVVTAAAIVIETVADNQLRAFARDPANRGRTIDVGLWSRSRHPNYFGEITFWWGLWLFGLAADPSWWWTVVGPVAMVALFLTASIPMMETRSLERRPSYADYQRAVPKLVPIRFRQTG